MRRLPLLVVYRCLFGLALALSANAASTPDHTVRKAWPAETMTGTIMNVDPGEELVVVRAGQVPFDIRVTRSTRILAGDKTLNLRDLSADKNHSVSVTFTPTGSGDIARTIHIMS
jgi:hypothetical protein